MFKKLSKTVGVTCCVLFILAAVYAYIARPYSLQGTYYFRGDTSFATEIRDDYVYQIDVSSGKRIELAKYPLKKSDKQDYPYVYEDYYHALGKYDVYIRPAFTGIDTYSVFRKKPQAYRTEQSWKKFYYREFLFLGRLPGGG